MKRRRVHGYCSVTTIRGSSWHLERSQYEPVRHAWLHGVRFVDTIGLQGDRITLRFDEVDSVIDFSPESVMAELEERRLNEAEDDLAGGGKI